jgi:hypothetical protein
MSSIGSNDYDHIERESQVLELIQQSRRNTSRYCKESKILTIDINAATSDNPRLA